MPARTAKLYQELLQNIGKSDGAMRMVGLVSMLIGVALLYLVN